MRFLCVAIVIVFVMRACEAGMFSWLFKSKAKKEDHEHNQDDSVHLGQPNGDDPETDVVLAAKIPFEITHVDEKFLKEAAAYTSLQLAKLDVCHHKVVLGLQSSCSELTEEELSKVAVNLLNCQSVAEGRPIYPCTHDMSLAQCTKAMDATTWNAYHIISNRARAVCYAARQEQFRAKSQMTVNKLMIGAEEQIRSISNLKESQEAIGRATSETLESLNTGHKHLQEQQQQLSTAQHAVRSFVSSNLRNLAREKSLISSGQRELALMTEAIRRKLDEAKEQLSLQENSQKDAHATILQDLATIQENALKVWEKLDKSTQKILQAHEDTVAQYGQLTDDLQRMNATVHHLMDVLQSTKRGVEDKLLWISSLVGGTDNTVQKVYSCLLHVGYFLAAMMSATFLQVPYMTRVALMIIVPMNAVSEMKHDTSLDFATLTSVLALCILVNLFVSLFLNLYWRQRNKIAYVNGSFHQPLVYCSPSAAFSPGSQVHGIVEPEVTKSEDPPAAINTSLDSSSLVMNSSMISRGSLRTQENHEYSSDDEVPPSPIPRLDTTSLRKRFMNGSSRKPESIAKVNEELSKHTDDATENVLNLGNSGSATRPHYGSRQSLRDCASLSSVRRQLLDHLDSSSHSAFLHSQSMDGRTLEATSSSRNSPASSRSNTPSRSMTPRKLCTSLCKNGQLCRNVVSGVSRFCHRHGGNSRESTPTTN